MIIHNKSMMKEYRADEANKRNMSSRNEKVVKNFGVKNIEQCQASVGHMYSFVVEHFNIENPNIKNFIRRVNSYGSPEAEIESVWDNIYCKRESAVKELVKEMFFRSKGITTEDILDGLPNKVHDEISELMQKVSDVARGLDTLL